MKYSIAIIFTFFIVASSIAGPWAKEVEKAYMKSCVDSASKDWSKRNAKKFCGCSMRKLQDLYPDATQLTNLTEEAIQKVVMECMK